MQIGYYLYLGLDMFSLLKSIYAANIHSKKYSDYQNSSDLSIEKLIV